MGEKDNAVELINIFKNTCIDYVSGHYLVKQMSKKGALICIQAQIDLLNDMYSDMDYGQSVRNYLDNKVEELSLIKTEIEKL